MDLAEFLKENPDAQKQLDALSSAAVTKAVGGLTTKNTELLDELKPLQSLKAKLGDDFSLEDYNKLRTELGDQKKAGFVDKGQIDKLIEAHDTEKSQWAEQYKKDVTDNKGLLDGYKSEIQRLVVDSELTRELSGVAVDESALDFLMYKAKPMLETIEIDGKTTARVKGGVKGDGTYKGIKELVSDLKEDAQYARYIKGSNQGGSGAPSHAGGGGNKQTLTSTQKIAQGLLQAS